MIKLLNWLIQESMKYTYQYILRIQLYMNYFNEGKIVEEKNK